jgi:hypothetical protein
MCELIGFNTFVASVPGVAVGVRATRACRIGDAELAGMEQQRIGISDVEMLLLFDEFRFLGSDCLNEALAQGLGQQFAFLRGKPELEVAFVLEVFEGAFMAMLGEEKRN